MPYILAKIWISKRDILQIYFGRLTQAFKLKGKQRIINSDIIGKRRTTEISVFTYTPKRYLRKMKSVSWKDMDWSPEQYLTKLALWIYKDEKDENINYIG